MSDLHYSLADAGAGAASLKHGARSGIVPGEAAATGGARMGAPMTSNGTSFGTSSDGASATALWWELDDEPASAVDVLRGHGLEPRPRPAAPQGELRILADHERFLASGLVSIAVVAAGMAIASLIAMALVSVPAGLAGLALTVVTTGVNASFRTPTRLAMNADGITFGYWGRSNTIDGKSLVVTHELRRDRYTIERRGARLRLARFGGGDDLVQHFVSRGIEIVTR